MIAVKKALVFCYVVQVNIIFLLTLGAFLSTSGVVVIGLNARHTLIIFVSNVIICAIIFIPTFKRNLKRISPKAYEELYNGNFLTNNLRYSVFMFDTKYDSNCVKKMKFYLRLFCLLPIIIFWTVPISFIILSFY